MPFGSVRLIPGINVEQTPTLLGQTGFSSSLLIRFRDSLAQKYGGWQKYFPAAVGGVPRELHPWQDLSQHNHLLVGTTTALDVITEGNLSDITPQTLTSDFTPDFSTVINTPTVTIIDPNISNVTINDSVLFETPVSIGGIVLNGLYPITAALGGSAYTITAASDATSTVSNAGTVPLFTTTSGSTQVLVTLNDHGITDSNVGTIAVFPIPTTGGGVTVSGSYQILSVVDANNYNINVNTLATSSTSFSMNGGLAELLYYIAIGPQALGAGYGTGGYGEGGYGTGTVGGQQTGFPITADDWTSSNWGEIALACPQNGPVYQYDPTGGFTNGRIVTSAPPINGGIFISTSLQILVCWASTQTYAQGIAQDPLLVKWSDVGDFTDFVPLTTNQAGSFRIPAGSRIMGGMSTPYQNLIWTDLDCWAMNYQGVPFVFGFNKIGAGAGLISSHAAQQLRGQVFWMGPSNFFATTGSGVQTIPCPVWDFVFQNINEDFVQNVRSMPNTNFNEAGWLFPSTASSNGECDCYVKVNIAEQGAPWDIGPSASLPRSAWTDQSILGNPIGATPTGIIYQHEETNNADGAPMSVSFTTGYFFLAEGEDFVFVDQILPDMRWGFYGSAQTAQIQLTFNVINFPGDTPTVFGPYTVTQSTEILSVRMRGRQMSITLASNDFDSFWRLGRIRYRYAMSGRR